MDSLLLRPRMAITFRYKSISMHCQMIKVRMLARLLEELGLTGSQKHEMRL